MSGRCVYLVRHGEVHNPDDIQYYRLPGFRLSDRGREEARAAAAFLQDADVGHIYHSPMERTRETATILAQTLGATTSMVEDINELEQGEAIPSILKRMRRFWDEIVAGPVDRPVLVSHREPLRILLLSLDGHDPDEHAWDVDMMPLPTAGVYRIELAGGKSAIELAFTPER